jgi:hypothetical protein
MFQVGATGKREREKPFTCVSVYSPQPTFNNKKEITFETIEQL